MKELTEYFTSNPTAQNVRIEARDVVEYPEITICPGYPTNYTALQLRGLGILDLRLNLRSGELQKSLKMSISEVVDFFTLKDLPRIVGFCYITPDKYGPCGSDNEWTWINGSRISKSPSKSGNHSVFLSFPCRKC